MENLEFHIDGWRGRIGEEIRPENLRRLAQAIADHLGTEFSQAEVALAYDAHFMGELFALEVAKVLLRSGIRVRLAMRDLPLAAVAAEVIGAGLQAGIYLSGRQASAYHSGLDYITFSGHSPDEALAATLNQRIPDKLIDLSEPLDLDDCKRRGHLQVTEMKGHYFDRLSKAIQVQAIRQSDLTIVFDPLYGSCRGYLDDFLAMQGVSSRLVNGYRDPYFGGQSPLPTESSLAHLQQMVTQQKGLTMGVATDAIGGLFAAVDQSGTIFSQETLAALLVDYLFESRPSMRQRKLVFFGAALPLVAKVASYWQVETVVDSRPSGRCAAIAADSFALSLDGTGHVVFADHLPQADGQLALLHLLELVAGEQRPLGKLVESLLAKL